jgi:hypothetical protein
MKVTQLPEGQEWTQLRELQRARMWQLALVRRWKRKLRHSRLRQYRLGMKLRKYMLYMLSQYRLRQYRLRKWLRQYMLFLLRHAAAQGTQLRELPGARMWQLPLVRRWKHKLRHYRLRQYRLGMKLRKYMLYMLGQYRLRQYRLRKWQRQYMLFLLQHAAAQAL